MGGLGSFFAVSGIIDFVKGIDFPCTKEDLINYAEDNNAPEKILDILQRLPDQDYKSVTDLTTAAVKAMV